MENDNLRMPFEMITKAVDILERSTKANQDKRGEEEAKHQVILDRIYSDFDGKDRAIREEINRLEDRLRELQGKLVSLKGAKYEQLRKEEKRWEEYSQCFLRLIDAQSRMLKDLKS